MALVLKSVKPVVTAAEILRGIEAKRMNGTGGFAWDGSYGQVLAHGIHTYVDSWNVADKKAIVSALRAAADWIDENTETTL